MAALTLPDVYLLLLHQFCALLIFFFFLLFHQRLRDDNPIYPILKIFIFSLTQSPLLHGSGAPPHRVLEQTRGPAPWPRPRAAASPLTAWFCPMKLPCQFYCRAAASFPHLWFVASPGCQGQTSPPPPLGRGRKLSTSCHGMENHSVALTTVPPPLFPKERRG